MWVAGTEARYKLPKNLGNAHLMFAHYRMEKVLYLAPALEVPQEHPLVHAAGRKLLSVRRKRDGSDGVAMAFQGANLRALFQVPKPADKIHAAGGRAFAIEPRADRAANIRTNTFNTKRRNESGKFCS